MYYTLDGYTPTQLAARYGHVEVTKFFVSIVENPNEQDINGLTPVQSAINGGHWEVVKIFALFVDNDEAKDALGWSSIYNTVMVSGKKIKPKKVWTGSHCKWKKVSIFIFRTFEKCKN